jgi:CPA2 family monovalent cation:H+ antiporter-2
MHDAHEFLRSLAVVLAVAAVTTVVFQRLRQPVVLGYIVAGLIVGPHVPLPLVADVGIVQTLSELGVILLMFSLGLEFSLAKLARVGPTATFTAVIQCSVMSWLGFLAGRLFGWSPLECVFTGAVVAISSTTIIAKVFDERRIGGRLRELVVGILLVEDLIAIVFMAALTAVAAGAGLSATALGATVGRLATFLAVLLVVGILVVPRLIRFVVRIGRTETTLVASIGVCFTIAVVAQAFGYSVALGAFLAGSLVAESGHGEEIEHLIRPVRDLFAAVFFVAVGMLIDPALVVRDWVAILVLGAVVVVGKITSVTLGAFLTGSGIRTAVQAGMSLAQIGEFSFIIAGLGLALGATRDVLYVVAVAVSALTTLSTPWLVAAAEPVAAFVDRKLPRPLQTLAALYGTWLERLGSTASTGRSAGAGRVVRLLALDMAVLSALIASTAVWMRQGADALARATGVAPPSAHALAVAVACAAAIPLLVGIGRLSHRLGSLLGYAALPRFAGKVDVDAAPRRSLVVTLQLGINLLAGAIVLAVTQGFLPSYAGPLVVVAVVVGSGVAIWRSATDLQSHVRAGAQAIVEVLTAHARGGPATVGTRPLVEVSALFPGLGEPVAVALDPTSPCIGRSLAELDLRGRTGATVLAIAGRGAPVVVPAGDQRLAAGDVLALAGTHDAIAAAERLLLGTPAADAGASTAADGADREGTRT